ncbi:hypothetical protein COCNU_07G015720 [Cocos nucifera]|uniref:Uncharacterized protein n=1 Tax=Cocos nucifera TaxID=13894 RepID=A0A8K0N566_COCNU|nr:hypothetical protein COCNU_07G015720 [Cocos nucifera]
MGWPYIGETFQLYSSNPNTFFSLKQKKYGRIVKTHILGCPCVMVSSPEAARFVLVTQAQMFKPTYPASKEHLLGPKAIFFQQGNYHARLRRIVLRAFMPDAIRGRVAGIEAVAIQALHSWNGRIINTFQEMKTYAFHVALLSIFGKDEIPRIDELKRCYYTLEKGYNSMPINLPGTLFSNATKARKQLGRIVADILSSRRQKKAEADDLLGLLMEAKQGLTDEQTPPFVLFFVGSMYAFHVALLSIFGKDEIPRIDELKRCYYTLEKGYNSMPINLPGTLFSNATKARKQLGRIVADILSSRRQKKAEADDLLGLLMEAKQGLTDEQIADNIIGVMFASRDTTASVLTWIVKYLGENPSILQAVTEEQVEIMRSKEMGEGESRYLTWADTKRMPMTSRVIQETMRVASILSFTFREAVEDVEYEGYLIPKGWKVLPLFRNIHHSPDNFTDPEKFDPSRFEVAPKPNTFMPFGNGTHSCPGNELAKLEMLVLLHHLTTKYRYGTKGIVKASSVLSLIG